MAPIDGIAIAHPCSASWAAMEGDDRARYCRLCSKVVHDTLAVTTCELEAMLASPTPPCLRVHRDRAGRVLTRDRLAALAFVGLAACSGGGDTAGADAGVGAAVESAVERVVTGALEEPVVRDAVVALGDLVWPPPEDAPLMGVPATDWRPPDTSGR